MLHNYLIVAWRNLPRNRLYATINVFGLAVGMAACLIILLYVSYELSFDRYHSKADRIFRVAMEREFGGQTSRSAGRSAQVGPELTSYFPDIEAVTRLVRTSPVVRHRQGIVQERGLAYADANIFRVFDLPLVHGDSTAALSAPHSLVLSATTARRYFGTANPVGTPHHRRRA